MLFILAKFAHSNRWMKASYCGSRAGLQLKGRLTNIVTLKQGCSFSWFMFVPPIISSTPFYSPAMKMIIVNTQNRKY